MGKSTDLIVLANSRKHGGRCVAGVDCKTLAWVRLVDDSDVGLEPSQTILDDGSYPSMLDLIRVETKALVPARLATRESEGGFAAMATP